MEQTKNYLGIWKFRDEKVSLEDLQSLAEEMAKDERYLSLHIRKCSKDQHGIGFEYQDSKENTKENFEEFMDNTADQFYKKVGNGLIGWDVSSEYYKIK